jgi:hypothetical protein
MHKPLLPLLLTGTGAIPDPDGSTPSIGNSIIGVLGRESFNKDIRGAGNVSINWHKSVILFLNFFDVFILLL